jgi:signal transduction histidine kinase
MNRVLRLDRWPQLSVAIVLAQLVISSLRASGPFLVAYSNFSYLFLILFATLIAARNAVRELHARGFWTLMTAGYGLWILSTLVWTYDVVVLRRNIPNLGLTDPPIFLHTVLFIAAVALGPGLNSSWKERRWSGLNLLLLLVCWVFLYVYVQLPMQGTPQALDTFTLLYSVENFLLVVTTGFLLLRTHSPAWKILYSHIFGAASLYIVGSFANNLRLSLTGSESGWIDALLTAAACWFVWIPLIGWKMSSELREGPQSATENARLVTLSAVSALIVISLAGIWGMRGHWASEESEFRLAIVLVSTLLIALVVATRDYFEQDKLATSLSTALAEQTHLKSERLEIGERLVQAQESERSRIARDLHDDINQRLAILTNNLRQIEQEWLDMQSRQMLHESIDQMQQLSLDIQHLSHQLHSSKLEYLGLPTAVRGLCEEFTRANKVRIERNIQDPISGVGGEIALALFRTLQEGLNNVAKHSRATVVKVDLVKSDSNVTIRLSDNGQGFDGNTDRHGLGLISMRERIRLVGGALRIWSQPSRGTRIEATVPVRDLESMKIIGFGTRS